ncbi:MAG: 1-acyl-sn-glycerol-3-phosphate acyltransferase [Deltaproteobacteria bacterium]|nr:1-acyl-sn-glycerol-3-phosphate acyltransferase [Deltaproteobacteria bacterium]
MKTVLRRIGSRVGESYSGTLYNGTCSVVLWFLRRLMGRIRMADDQVEEVRRYGREGIVVYALTNKSQLDALILKNLCDRNDLPKPLFCHNINMILWQPALKALRAAVSRIFYDPSREEILRRITLEQSSSIIYLRGSEFLTSPYQRDPLLQLIAAQEELDRPIIVVPHMIIYSKRREKHDKTIADLFFGQTENPGMLRRLILFLRFSKQTFAVAADGLDMKAFLAEHQARSPEMKAFYLRRELVERINAEKRSIFGPLIKSREEIISAVLREPEMMAFMEQTAQSEGRPYLEILSRARKHLMEIAADYTDTYIGFFDKALTWLWNNIYDGIVVDQVGMAKIRQLAKRMPIVVIPCHRSHIDYLLLSYVLYHNNLQMPFIAAGINMAFWPFGHIFRKSGAFFLRRSFKGNDLYGMVFTTYVKVLIQGGWPVEFFIEGGRSRTGKMVMPRFGLLSMVIQAFVEGAAEDLAIIPVYLGYDRVIEEKSYRQELNGAQKAKENTRSLIKSRGILKKRYGSVYLNVGEPILLKSYLASLETSFEDMDLSQRQRFYRKTSYEIADRINKVSVVTPFSLAAAGLLCHYKRGISREDLMEIFDALHDYLAYRGASFADTFVNREKAMTDALDLMESSGLIAKLGFSDEDEEEEFEEIIYSIDEDERLTLEYYKNNILHFFLSIAFVATSILASREDAAPLKSIIEDFRFIKRLFRQEFIFDDHVDDVDEVNDVLSYIHNRGMIRGGEREGAGWIELKGLGREKLMIFAGLLFNYIESYWITLRSCSYLRAKSRQERDFLKKIQRLGEKMYKKGEVSKAEALSQLTYKSALRFLADAGIINVSFVADESKKRSEKMLALTDDRHMIESMRRRLFKFMSQ